MIANNGRFTNHGKSYHHGLYNKAYFINFDNLIFGIFGIKNDGAIDNYGTMESKYIDWENNNIINNYGRLLGAYNNNNGSKLNNFGDIDTYSTNQI